MSQTLAAVRRRVTSQLVMWLAEAGWVTSVGLIFFMSNQAAPSSLRPYPDYLLHFTEYFVFSAATALMLYTKNLPISPNRLAATAWLISGVYGFLDEIHQAFIPERVSSYRDLCADLAGGTVFLGLLLLYFSCKAALTRS